MWCPEMFIGKMVFLKKRTLFLARKMTPKIRPITTYGNRKGARNPGTKLEPENQGRRQKTRRAP
jgi:hypothetical protein